MQLAKQEQINATHNNNILTDMYKMNLKMKIIKIIVIIISKYQKQF